MRKGEYPTNYQINKALNNLQKISLEISSRPEAEFMNIQIR
jgi:hypothetical protein